MRPRHHLTALFALALLRIVNSATPPVQAPSTERCIGGPIRTSWERGGGLPVRKSRGIKNPPK